MVGGRTGSLKSTVECEWVNKIAISGKRQEGLEKVANTIKKQKHDTDHKIAMATNKDQ